MGEREGQGRRGEGRAKRREKGGGWSREGERGKEGRGGKGAREVMGEGEEQGGGRAIAWSPKKKPILTMVRTMPIREPRPGVLSRARSWAFIDWSYG